MGEFPRPHAPSGDQLTHIWSLPRPRTRVSEIERGMARSMVPKDSSIELSELVGSRHLDRASSSFSAVSLDSADTAKAPVRPRGRMLPWMVTLPDHYLQWMMAILYLSVTFAIIELYPRESVSSWRVKPNYIQNATSTEVMFIIRDNSGSDPRNVKYRAFELSLRLAEVIGSRAGSTLKAGFAFHYFEPSVPAEVTIRSRCDNWEDDAAYNGTLFKEITTVIARDCFAACEAEKYCNYFVWESKSGSCRQLDTLTGSVSSEGTVSGGRKHRSDFPGCVGRDRGYVWNARLAGSGTVAPDAVSSPECSHECLKDIQCLAWTFTKACILLYTPSENVSMPGGVSGPRTCRDRDTHPHHWPVLARRDMRLGALMVGLLTRQSAGEICQDYVVQLTFPFLILDASIPEEHRQDWGRFPLAPTLKAVQTVLDSKASVTQIVWRLGALTVLICIGFPALYTAGRRTNWTWSRLPLGFFPSVLQAIGAVAEVDPSAVFNRAFAPSKWNVWRLMVRAQILIMLWSLFLYARMLSDSLQPTKKLHRSTLIMVFFSVVYVALVMQANSAINENGPFAIVDETHGLMLTFLATWLLAALCLWTCLTAFIALSKTLSELSYSECWLQSQIFRFMLMVLSVSVFANTVLRVGMTYMMSNGKHDAGQYRYTSTIPLQWVTFNRVSGGMILRETDFRTDLFGCVVNMMVALIMLIAFLPRGSSPEPAEEDGDEEHIEASAFAARRFPPCISSREIMKMRFLLHCCRVINKLEKLKGCSSGMDEFAQEPFDSEEDIRESFSSLRVRGDPISGKEVDVHAALLTGNFRGRRVAIVTFRGTKGLTNIKADLKARMDELEDPEGDDWYQDLRQFSGAKARNLLTKAKKRYIQGIAVHKGFQESLAIVKDKLIQALLPLVRDGEPVDIWCVGHSFGGALGTLLAVKVHKLLSVVDPDGQRTSLNVFCVGSPRVGNSEFRRYFNDRSIGCVQLAHDHDPITSLPPALFGYRRVGRLALLSTEGHVRSDPGFLEMSMRTSLMAIGAVFLLPLAAAGMAGWADGHKLAKYMVALQKAQEKETSAQAVTQAQAVEFFVKRQTLDGRARDKTVTDFSGDITGSAGVFSWRKPRWVLDEHTFGHARGMEVELPEEAAVCGHRALAPLFGSEAVLLRRIGE